MSINEKKQEAPWSFRPYPQVKERVDSLEREYKRRRKHFNRNHFINLAIGMAEAMDLDAMEKNRRA